MIDRKLDADDLVDALMDLKHDLGKYVRLPFAMLGDDPSREELEDALRTAVFNTRRGPSGVQSARVLWNDFLAEAKESMEGYAPFQGLRAVVERVLDHGDALEKGAFIEWASVREDVSEVAPAIARVIEEVSNG